MADFIDKQATMNAVGLTTDATNFNPTKYVDAQGNELVAVVRCKDCKYSEPSVYPQAVNCTVLSKAIREWVEGYGCPATDLIMTVFEDHYCGWGERREDAETN